MTIKFAIMIQENSIRCISVKGDRVRYIVPRLANDDNFLKEIGYMRQELPTIEVEEIEEPVLESNEESKPKKAKRK